MLLSLLLLLAVYNYFMAIEYRQMLFLIINAYVANCLWRLGTSSGEPVLAP